LYYQTQLQQLKMKRLIYRLSLKLCLDELMEVLLYLRLSLLSGGRRLTVLERESWTMLLWPQIMLNVQFVSNHYVRIKLLS
jgi:hypothetical protein